MIDGGTAARTRRRTPPAPAGRNLGQVWITVVFAGLTVAGVLVVTVLGIRNAERAESMAATAEIASDATVLLRRSIVALQHERTMAEVWLTERSIDARLAYRDSHDATDESLERLDQGWRMHRDVLEAAGPPTLPDLRESFSTLPELRTASLRLGEESAVAAYSGVVEVLSAAARRMEVIAADSTLMSRIRALVRVMAAEEALASQRDVVVEYLTDDHRISQDELIRLFLFEQEARTNLGSIRALEGGILGAGITDFLTGMRTDSAQEMLNDLRQGERDVDPLVWHAAATGRLDGLGAIADELEATLTVAADGLRESAELARRQRTVGLLALLVVSIMAAVAAVGAARDRAMALTEHGDLASGLYEWFLPDRLAEFAGVKVAARYDAASEYTLAGGDWYDLYRTGDGRIAVTVGDVAGHGATATAQMAQIRNLLRGITLATQGSPAAQLRTLDDALQGSGTMATVFHALLDVERGELVYARAGHLAGFVRRAGGVDSLDAALGSPLGVESSGEYTEATVTLKTSSQIVVFTDGVVEERGEDIEQAMAALASVLAEASGDVDEVADSLIDARSSRRDDAALLVVRWDGEAAEPAPTGLPHPPASP